MTVTIHLEAGHGETPEVAGETIALAFEVGAIGCNLENSFPTNGKLRETVDQADRIPTRSADGRCSQYPLLH